jgi:hypothetical protein
MIHKASPRAETPNEIGLDYWQVISHYPDHFKALEQALSCAGHLVYVISAVGKNRAGTVKAEVERFSPKRLSEAPN